MDNGEITINGYMGKHPRIHMAGEVRPQRNVDPFIWHHRIRAAAITAVVLAWGWATIAYFWR